jgi:chromosome segregation ATPase
MDSYPDLRDQLLPATLRLSEALPCVSAFLSIDIGELNERLTEVERRLSLLELDVSQLKVDVAQLKVDVAQLKVDIAQLKEDVGGMREDIAGIKKWIESADRIYATKEDLHKQTWRLYGAMASLTAAVYFIARYVH